MASAHFRAGVVMVVRHPDLPQVLAFERVDVPGAWQLPQGGLRAGESPHDAAWRELQEETGLGEADVELVSEHPEWLAYEWPADVRADHKGLHHRIGQVQRWFFFVARSAAVEPTPDGNEFRDWRWAESEWLTAQVPVWRRGTYAHMLRPR